jgi:hypothetical protein
MRAITSGQCAKNSACSVLVLFIAPDLDSGGSVVRGFKTHLFQPHNGNSDSNQKASQLNLFVV